MNRIRTAAALAAKATLAVLAWAAVATLAPAIAALLALPALALGVGDVATWLRSDDPDDSLTGRVLARLRAGARPAVPDADLVLETQDGADGEVIRLEFRGQVREVRHVAD